MLQNRLNPFGDIIRTSARGAWTGTRGIIHDANKNIVRPFRHRAWISCLLEFKGRRRIMMQPNRYTELFSLDEATAFAAGHRPCCECRRTDFNRFKAAWLKGNPGYGFTEKVSVNEIDRIIHAQRIDGAAKKISYEEDMENIPDGSFVSINGQPFLLYRNSLYEWSAFGYKKGMPALKKGTFTVLTPASVVNAFRAGYEPQMAIVRGNK